MPSAAHAQEQPIPETDLRELDRIIEGEYSRDRENLIMMLQAIQRHYNHLPEGALRYLARKLDLPLSQIYSVGTFYKTFSLKPRGRHIVSVCLGTACHVRGGDRVKERIEGCLGVSEGETTRDGQFTLEAVRCIGCCSLGPVVKVDEDIHSRIAVDKVQEMLAQYGEDAGDTGVSG